MAHTPLCLGMKFKLAFSLPLEIRPNSIEEMRHQVVRSVPVETILRLFVICPVGNQHDRNLVLYLFHIQRYIFDKFPQFMPRGSESFAGKNTYNEQKTSNCQTFVTQFYYYFLY